MQVAIIPADISQPIRFEDLTAGLGPMQEAVGGDIQMVGLRAASLNMYINENGKMEGLPANHRATILSHWAEAIRHDDVIAGDVVLVGPTDDEEGADTSITAEHVAFLERFAQTIALADGRG